MIPVILSGGSGTRLWPVSRAHYPKQFCEFYDQSFLDNSIERLESFGSPHIITVGIMEALTQRSLKEKGLPMENAIYEPYGKNTAPAVALMCHLASLKGQGEEVLGIFPADHLITKEDAFKEAIELGIKCADKGEVVTLGIQPRYASTGYGYIEIKGKDVAPFMEESNLKAHQVEGFREKPDAKKAQEFLMSGLHYWNAGMFLFKVNTMIAHFKEFLPEMWDKISKIKEDFSNAKYIYANIESISLDYGIMEKLKSQICIPCDIGWSDVGSWDEIARLADEVPSLRREINAKVITEDALSNYVFSIRDKVVGLVGVDNLIVVDTPDGLLITKKGKSEEVKSLVEKMRSDNIPVATESLFEARPWGGFEILSDFPDFKTKRISVDPGEQLSYQSHEKRSEHWIIIQGQAEVVLNDDTKSYKAGEHVYIPAGAKHRIKNTGDGKLTFVEVQTGSYFGEDDIVRYEDDYGRD